MSEEKKSDISKSNKKRGSLRVLTGTVVSNKMRKTIVVKVVSTKIDKKYKKVINVSKKYKVDCQNEKMYPEGTVVRFVYCRPISRWKRWRVLKSNYNY